MMQYDNLNFQVAGRLRSRIADQLVNELDPPDHHETIMKLREMQLNGSVK